MDWTLAGWGDLSWGQFWGTLPLRNLGKEVQERKDLEISVSVWLAVLTLGQWYSAALSAACQACQVPVSGARVGPSLVWALSCRGDPYLPSLAASGSSDTATLYPVQETKKLA